MYVPYSSILSLTVDLYSLFSLLAGLQLVNGYSRTCKPRSLLVAWMFLGRMPIRMPTFRVDHQSHLRPSKETRPLLMEQLSITSTKPVWPNIHMEWNRASHTTQAIWSILPGVIGYILTSLATRKSENTSA